MSQKTWQELTDAYKKAHREVERISAGPIPNETEPHRIWQKALSEAIIAREEILSQRSQYMQSSPQVKFANAPIQQDNILVERKFLEDIVDELTKLLDGVEDCPCCEGVFYHHKASCRGKKLRIKIKDILEES